MSTENRELVDSLERCEEPSIDELAATIARLALASRGIGLVDTAVLHAALSGQAEIWTSDASLSTVAEEVGVDLYTSGL